MKIRVYVEVEVSPTMADTMKRTGFMVCNNGSSMQVKIGNSPAVSRRKSKVLFLDEAEETQETLCTLLDVCSSDEKGKPSLSD